MNEEEIEIYAMHTKLRDFEEEIEISKTLHKTEKQIILFMTRCIRDYFINRDGNE